MLKLLFVYWSNYILFLDFFGFCFWFFFFSVGFFFFVISRFFFFWIRFFFGFFCFWIFRCWCFFFFWIIRVKSFYLRVCLFRSFFFCLIFIVFILIDSNELIFNGVFWKLYVNIFFLNYYCYGLFKLGEIYYNYDWGK